MHDPRLGRFFAIDPLAPKYPHNSPYAFSENTVINAVELEGLERYFTNDGAFLGQVGDDTSIRVFNDIANGSDRANSIKNEINVINQLKNSSVGVTESGKSLHNQLEKKLLDSSKETLSSFSQYPIPKESTGWAFGEKGVQEKTVNNGIDLAEASLLNKDIANLGGSLLQAVKNDPAMLAYQSKILVAVKNDPRYKKEPYFYSDLEIIEFGGKRGSGNDWFSFGENDPVLKIETWKVATNQLTWALRHARVRYWALIDENGAVTIHYRLYDTLDLSKQKGRSGAYNKISSRLGFFYHDIAGGNKNLQTRAKWTIEIK